MPIIRGRFSRPCTKCGETFRKTSKHSFVCDRCIEENGKWRERTVIIPKDFVPKK